MKTIIKSILVVVAMIFVMVFVLAPIFDFCWFSREYAKVTDEDTRYGIYIYSFDTNKRVQSKRKAFNIGDCVEFKIDKMNRDNFFIRVIEDESDKLNYCYKQNFESKDY